MKQPIRRLGDTRHLRQTGFNRRSAARPLHQTGFQPPAGPFDCKEDGLRMSIVIPSYRCARQIGFTLDRLGNFLMACPWHSEIIVVDDHSSDATAQVAASYQGRIPGLRVLRHGARRGLGAAARTGVAVASGRHVVVCDARIQCPLTSLYGVTEHLEHGADVVVASPRLMSTSSLMLDDKPLITRLTDTAFRALTQFVVPLDVQDAHAGMIGFRRAVAQKIATRSRITGKTFDVEWLAMARRFGHHVMEIAVGSPEYRAGSASRRGASPKHWRDLCRIRWNLGREEYELGAERPSLEDTRYVKIDRGALFGSDAVGSGR